MLPPMLPLMLPPHDIKLQGLVDGLVNGLVIKKECNSETNNYHP